VIPVIDISPLRQPATDAERARCTGALHSACLETGFFVVVGHGLEDLIEVLFDGARRFFALAQADKEQVPRLDRYGYVPHSSTAIDTSRQSTNTEYLDIGLANEIELPELPGLDCAVRNYQAGALGVGSAIIRSLATALDLDPGFFAASMAQPQCRLRFLHYPSVEPRNDGTLPIPTSSHTDYGLITLLATDGVPGLEVRTLDGRWMPINVAAGSLIINLGDMLARWTNDVYKSTPHRVVGPAKGERYSIPFFVNPDPATVVECIPTCVTQTNPCQYEPVSAGEFLAMRIDTESEPYVDPHEGPARRATA
jgi:isopenicillin N synthase-like dioxygenase